MLNADPFLNACSAMERTLPRMAEQSRDVSFTRLVDRLRVRNRLVGYHRIDLKQYAELRNALVHERTGNGAIIAEPHPNVVTVIQPIATTTWPMCCAPWFGMAFRKRRCTKTKRVWGC